MRCNNDFNSWFLNFVQFKSIFQLGPELMHENSRLLLRALLARKGANTADAKVVNELELLKGLRHEAIVIPSFQRSKKSPAY